MSFWDSEGDEGYEYEVAHEERAMGKDFYHRDLPDNDVDYYSDLITKYVMSDKRKKFLDVLKKKAMLCGYSTIMGICTTVNNKQRISQAQLNCLVRFCCNKIDKKDLIGFI